MEISHQQIDRPELIARCDENIGRARPWANDAIFTGSALDQAQRCCADTDYPATSGMNGIQRIGSFLRNVTNLGMHLMVRGVVGFDRQKRARPHMQRYEMFFDATIADFLEQIGCEMQPGSRCCNSPFLTRINSLIISAVALIFSALGCDIRRQRNVADRSNGFIQHRARKIEHQQSFTRVTLLSNGCVECSKEAD